MSKCQVAADRRRHWPHYPRKMSIPTKRWLHYPGKKPIPINGWREVFDKALRSGRIVRGGWLMQRGIGLPWGFGKTPGKVMALRRKREMKV